MLKQSQTLLAHAMRTADTFQAFDAQRSTTIPTVSLPCSSCPAYCETGMLCGPTAKNAGARACLALSAGCVDEAVQPSAADCQRPAALRS